MNYKEFLKPSLGKVILFLILMILTSAIPNFGLGIWWHGADIGINYGFPFNFYGCCGGPPLEIGQSSPVYYYYEAIIYNLIIWYLVSCSIIFIYNRVKK